MSTDTTSECRFLPVPRRTYVRCPRLMSGTPSSIVSWKVPIGHEVLLFCRFSGRLNKRNLYRHRKIPLYGLSTETEFLLRGVGVAVWPFSGCWLGSSRSQSTAPQLHPFHQLVILTACVPVHEHCCWSGKLLQWLDTRCPIGDAIKRYVHSGIRPDTQNTISSRSPLCILLVILVIKMSYS